MIISQHISHTQHIQHKTQLPSPFINLSPVSHKLTHITITIAAYNHTPQPTAMLQCSYPQSICHKYSAAFIRLLKNHICSEVFYLL